MIGTPWLSEYRKYISNIVVFDNTINELLADENEVTKFGIIFKFPNGYHAIVEFYTYEHLEGCYDDYVVTMDVNVEMLDKECERYTDVSFDVVRNSKFPEKRRKEILLKNEVEEFLKAVMEI